ncbi:unnamed protein product [Calypogeia fissa]
MTSLRIIDPAVCMLSMPIAVVLGAVLLLWVLRVFTRSKSRSRNRGSAAGSKKLICPRLPKGSFGWPILGETLEFARSPENFAASHHKRYGTIFKSNLFLRPVILGTTPDFTRFVCNNSHLFTVETPANVRKLGTKACVVKDGPSHMSVKKVLQKALLPEALRSRVEMLETIILQNLASWESEHCGNVVGRDGCQRITLETATYILFGVPNIGSTPEGQSVLSHLDSIGHALFAFPVNLPGTALNKAIQAKKSLNLYIKHLVEKRRDQEHAKTDMLGVLLAAKDDPNAQEDVKALDEESVLDNLVGMWFGFYETTSTTLTWVLKFLAEYPEVFQRVQAEQEEILKGKDRSVNKPRLTWDDTRKMVYTLKFFKELQRMISLGAVVPRSAAEDVEYNGYLIPKGWAVFPMTNFIHSDPNLYPDPEVFNPDRFDDPPKPYTYLPFSSGPHMCPGAEVAKLISFILIHHLTTTYIFEKTGPNRGTEHRPFPTPVGGYPINIRRRK